MKTKILIPVLGALILLPVLGAPTLAVSGPCGVPDDTASDGSRCGGRAASERPGGKDHDETTFERFKKTPKGK